MGQDDTPADDLAVVWDARQFLGGDYVLACTLTDKAGNVSLHEWPFSIGSSSTLAGPWLPENTDGVFPLTWEANGLPADAMLDVGYSPDNGAHWVGLGSFAASDGRTMVDAATLPDSRNARFQLVWEQGAAYVAAQSQSVVIENHNDSPQLALLSPRPGQALASLATVTWQASDPDGDELDIVIWARQAGGAWITVARGLANTGRYEWDTAALRAGVGWEVAVEASDPLGAVRQEVVGGLTVTHDRAPAMRLVWPNAEVALNGETVVLWSAFDLDGDTVLVDLYYSDNAGRAWYPLAEGLPNTGYYSWETAFVPPGSAYRVRAVAHDGQLVRRVQSSGLSTIGGSGLGAVALAAPTAGASVRGIAAVCWRTLNSAAEWRRSRWRLAISSRAPSSLCPLVRR